MGIAERAATIRARQDSADPSRNPQKVRGSVTP